MVKRVQWIGHITAEADVFIGRQRELTVDITTNEIRVHDGATAGGHRVLTKEQNDVLYMSKTQADFTGAITVDTINEHTGNAGVTVDGVLIKDGLVDGVDVSVRDTFLTQVDTDLGVAEASLAAHIANISNPHAVTKTQVGLANVTNDAQLKIASNLSDLNNVVTARSNLGLAALATKATIDNANLIDDGIITNAEINASAAIVLSKLANATAASRLVGRRSGSAGAWEEITLAEGLSLSTQTLRGSVLQRSYTEQTTPIADGAHIIPADNTTPTNTEGAQLFSVVFTPILAASRIKLQGVVTIGCSTQSIGAVLALYKDGTCIAVFPGDNVSNALEQIAFFYEEAATNTTARTYMLRYGVASGTIAINDNTGATIDYGNKCRSNIIIEEFI